MGQIKGKATKIIETRREQFLAFKALKEILNLFEASEDLDLLVWQVSLIRNPKSENEGVKTFVAFGTQSDSIHFNKEDLLEDKHIKMKEEHPIIQIMTNVDKLLDENVLFSIKTYLEKNSLDNFNVNYQDNRLTIEIDQATICEKKETQK